MAIDKLLTGSLGSQVKELMATEDIMIEAVRDLVKDEIKTYIRDKVEADPVSYTHLTLPTIYSV